MLPLHLPPHPSNIIYGHQLYPSRSSSSGIHLASNICNNNQRDCNNNVFRYPPTSQQNILDGSPPLIYLDGVWHLIPPMSFPHHLPLQQQQQQQFYGGNFFMMHEPPPPFNFPPQPCLDDVFDYDNAIFLDEDRNDGQAVRYGRPGLRRLTSSEIIIKLIWHFWFVFSSLYAANHIKGLAGFIITLTIVTEFFMHKLMWHYKFLECDIYIMSIGTDKYLVKWQL